MFHETSTKLTGLYLAIVLIISVAFSAVVYQLSTQEFARTYQHQQVILQRGPSFGLTPSQRDLLLREESERYEDARLHVLRRLLLVNLLILIGGGFLSYYLARRTLQPIEASHQALERFTADASHELRTPLAAMRTETEVALMDPKLTLAQAKEKLRSNLEEVQKLTTLSDGLLRLARLERGGLSLQPVPVSKVIEMAVQQVQPLADAKAIAFTVEVSDKLKVKIEPASVTEVLVIILDNAIKYSPEQSKVHLAARVQQQKVLIQIRDEGMGIEAADLRRIFERFYRADSARTKPATGGYGLGLAIARDIILLQGGDIQVQSKAGKGSTFIITLPLV